tara:strand:+ start:356 stop:529 length:174 start_codon:yes stop_codon:yes gene_type:complete
VVVVRVLRNQQLTSVVEVVVAQMEIKLLLDKVVVELKVLVVLEDLVTLLMGQMEENL